MKLSKRVMRRHILLRMFERLQAQSNTGVSRQLPPDDRFSLTEIDALLAFKSDPGLQELRCALDRIEDGSYGICLVCKGTISQDILDEDPAQRVCETCEMTVFHTLPHQLAAHRVS